MSRARVLARTGRLHKILMVVFKSLFLSTYPGYLKELFALRNSSYSLRGNNILTLPKPRTTNYGLKCIRYQAAKIWNLLPDRTRTITSIKDFKTVIRKMNFLYYLIIEIVVVLIIVFNDPIDLCIYVFFLEDISSVELL